MDKHYDATYLQTVTKMAGEIKQISYKPFVDLKEGVIVDLGCGNGYDANQLQQVTQEKVRVAGLDHDSRFIEKAEKEYPDVTFYTGDVEDLPFSNEEVQGVRSERMFQHLVNPERVISEIKRVLKPAGTMVLLDTDWPGINFHTRHIAIENKIRDYLTYKKVNFGLSARKLPEMVMDHHFSIKEFAFHKVTASAIEDLHALIKYTEFIKELTTENVLTDSEAELFDTEIKKRDATETLNCSIEMMYIHA